MKLPKYLDDDEDVATATSAEGGGGGGSSLFYRDCSQRGSFKYTSTFSSNPHVYFNDGYADPLDLIKQSSPTLTEKFKKDTRGAISIEKRKNRNRGSREEGYFESEAKIRNFDIFEPRDVYEEPETFINRSSSSEKQRSRGRYRARVHTPREETLVESPSLPPKLPPKKIINQHSSVLLPPPPIPPHLISTSRRREIRESGGGGGGGGGGGVVRERNFKKQLPTGDNNNFKSTTFRVSSTSRKNYNKTRHDNDEEEDPRRLREKNVFKLLSDNMRMKLKVKENF